MPKAVAVLEGDSTDLVQSIEKAKSAMQKLEGEGRKLTDQLRDVADEADKAAGSLVNKIGGGTAIKAIAGVTAGFAAAQTALGAFTGSMQAFYSTQGEKGAKAMADIDTALNKLQGQLFTAVMGTDNLEEATQTLLDVIRFLTDAVNVALTPIRAMGVLVRYLADTNIDATREAKAHADEMVRQSELSATLKTNYDNVTVAIAKNRLNVMQLTGSTEELRKVQIRQQMDVLNGLADQLKAAETAREEQEIGLEVASKTQENYAAAINTAVQSGMVPGTEEFSKMVSDVYAGLTLGALHLAREARKGWSKETSEALAGLGADYEKLQLKLFAVGQEAETTNRRISAVGRSAAPGAGGAAPEENAAMKAANAFIEQQRRQWAEEDAHALRVQATEEKNTKLIEERDAKWKAENQAKIDGIQAVGKEYAQLAADQIATGEKASKIAEKLARKAIGGQISALGDEAMAKAAIYAAALNPLAIPMAAAGVAAYAAAAALGSDSKKAASSTPAAAAPVQAAPVNTSFNLRVDAAFADGESIARQFAMMQQSAQRRGLVPRGAY